MTSLRRTLANSPRLALWLVVAALAVRLLVPAGYMLSPTRPLALVACPGVTPVAHHGHDGSPAHQQAPDQPCAFAALAAPLAVAAVAVLATLTLLVAATPTPRLRAAAAPRAPPRWRPPLRAPPLALVA
ncbi:hypothetical protein KZ820_13355 [Sphingomonas sp. RRHST34]|uniref:DUF2946 domain-containing protein n=1 Tax=Sphingomonas citri TaxID=2862499 RepID=A0ABS7BQD6_9SPHN|nr:hypothetical protein [Sphingomonas citri]MBW6531725.1 hypothetical protein [Sphingomonas citri]